MAAFVKKSGYSTDEESESDRIFDEFCADRETIAALGVTAEEFRELSRASLLGTLTSKDDLLFMLRQIRAAMEPAERQQDKRPIRDLTQLAETMRVEALAKLDELDLKAARRSRTAVGRLEAAWAGVSMKLVRARLLILQMSQKLARRAVS